MKKIKKVVVTTAWGEINKNAIYLKDTGFCYFKTKSGYWLNYEPQSVRKYEPAKRYR